ncbi:hypothetical protein V6N13_028536 [Hibiscus sabdariffa]
MESKRFALLLAAMAVAVLAATAPTVTAARNGAMPFSIVNIRNPFANIFGVQQPAENCYDSGYSPCYEHLACCSGSCIFQVAETKSTLEVCNLAGINFKQMMIQCVRGWQRSSWKAPVSDKTSEYSNQMVAFVNGHHMNIQIMFLSWTSCISTACVSILINESPTNSFPINRGLRQGCLLSPLLFNLIVEALSSILRKAKTKGLFKGVRIRNSRESVSHLYFADDLIVFCEASGTEVNNITGILKGFEVISGLKVNMKKRMEMEHPLKKELDRMGNQEMVLVLGHSNDISEVGKGIDKDLCTHPTTQAA